MFKSKFNLAFTSLNSAQRAAAETIEGPVLIVAGPGTGKTQTLALRLANILKKTQARPHNLLALTFTEAAAVELKKRLASIIGPDAYGITASTFHSFCSRLAGTFPGEFAGNRENTQLDALGQFKLLAEILEKGEYPLLRPQRDPGYQIRNLSKALQDLKREGITPEKLEDLAKKAQMALPTGEERLNKKTGKVLGRVADGEKVAAKQIELVRFYTEYQRLLAEHALADYDDLILNVVHKLTPPNPPLAKRGAEEDSFLLAYLQENYLYATVDEFQDTNGAQNAILSAWASYDDAPNLCVVGDDDQSIYRFQGASLINILDFHERYPKAKIVTLTENYRSTQVILDASRALIENNQQRLTNKISNLSKNLTASPVNRTPKTEPRKPKVLELVGAEDEATFITSEIQRLIKLSSSKPEDIVVLYRRRRSGNLLADYLHRAGVPVARLDGENALTDRRVRQLIMLLTAIDQPSNPVAQLTVLSADYTDLPPTDIYRLARGVDRDNNFLDFLADEKKLKAWGQGEVADKLQDLKSLLDFGSHLLHWQRLLREVNVLELAEVATAGSGLTQKIEAGEEYSSAEALTAFLGWLRSTITARPDVALAEILADLKLMQSQGISLPLPRRAHAAVTLTTVHGAKGLEWTHVFVTNCTDEEWRPQRNSGLKLPLEFTAPETPEEALEEERRLMYVAMTRAKESLTLTVAANYGSRKTSTPSQFLAELPDQLIQREKLTIPAKTKFALALPHLNVPKIDRETKRYLASLVEHYRLSPTALNTYLICPHKFLFMRLLKLPTVGEPHLREVLAFGSAAHSALENYYQEFKHTNTPPTDTAVTAWLESALDREPLTRKQKQRVLRDEAPALQEYLATRRGELKHPLFTEYDFSAHDVRLGDIPLSGKVDRIDPMPETSADVVFIDYKTKKPRSRNDILGKTGKNDLNDYRQLLFYILLSELDNRFIYTAKKVTLSFIHRDGSRDETFEPTTAEIEELKKLISEIFAKIQALEFDRTEDQETCQKCDFREVCGR